MHKGDQEFWASLAGKIVKATLAAACTQGIFMGLQHFLKEELFWPIVLAIMPLIGGMIVTLFGIIRSNGHPDGTEIATARFRS